MGMQAIGPCVRYVSRKYSIARLFLDAFACISSSRITVWGDKRPGAARNEGMVSEFTRDDALPLAFEYIVEADIILV